MSDEQLLREGSFVYLPLVMTGIYAVALGLGFAWRKVPAIHGRFMACTTLPLLDPVFARVQHFYLPPLPAEFLYQVPAFALATVVLVRLSRSLPDAVPGKRSLRAFSAGTIVALLFFFVTPYSHTWLAFVAWFRVLPIT